MGQQVRRLPGGEQMGRHACTACRARLRSPLLACCCSSVLVQQACAVSQLLHHSSPRPPNATPRFALVAAFLVSPYGCAGRTWKPFNPLLGETFELALGESGTFFAEQVSGSGCIRKRGGKQCVSCTSTSRAEHGHSARQGTAPRVCPASVSPHSGVLCCCRPSPPLPPAPAAGEPPPAHRSGTRRVRCMDV